MCEYTAPHFGARYDDAICLDGYLWDLDSDDGDGLTSGGDLPCPACNTVAYLDGARADAESTAWGSEMFSRYSGAMIMEGALRVAGAQNLDACAAWKLANPEIQTFDWPDRAAVLSGRADPNGIVEFTMRP